MVTSPADRAGHPRPRMLAALNRYSFQRSILGGRAGGSLFGRRPVGGERTGRRRCQVFGSPGGAAPGQSHAAGGNHPRSAFTGARGLGLASSASPAAAVRVAAARARAVVQLREGGPLVALRRASEDRRRLLTVDEREIRRLAHARGPSATARGRPVPASRPARPSARVAVEVPPRLASSATSRAPETPPRARAHLARPPRSTSSTSLAAISPAASGPASRGPSRMALPRALARSPPPPLDRALDRVLRSAMAAAAMRRPAAAGFSFANNHAAPCCCPRRSGVIGRSTSSRPPLDRADSRRSPSARSSRARVGGTPIATRAERGRTRGRLLRGRSRLVPERVDARGKVFDLSFDAGDARDERVEVVVHGDGCLSGLLR